jgi:hypothetical protein
LVYKIMVMEAKEKAKELFQKMTPDDNSTHPKIFGHAKQCALIAVDEIMKATSWHELEEGVERDNYWDEVKQEIEKL